MEPERRVSSGEAPGASNRGGETLGLLAAILSSSIGGMNTAFTRYVIGATDPVTLAGMRFGLGFLLLLPMALLLGSRWPKGRDWLGVAMLGILFFAIFMGLFNLSLRYTSAARGALALSTLPLVTMLAASALRAEPLTRRKSVGVLIAIGGVAIALITGLGDAPRGAWRGDAIMLAATLCIALYSIWSRPFIARSSPLGFVTAGMGSGSLVVCLLALAGGGFASTGDFGVSQWAAVGYLAIFGAALTFFLWVFALARTTPTKVTNTITLNPLTASIVATFLVGEPIGLSLIVGIAAVFTGILIASTGGPGVTKTPAGGSSVWRTAIGRLRLWLGEQHQRRMSVDQLQVMNDAELHDIGLAREDITGDIDRRLWEPRLGMVARNARPRGEEDWRSR
ncbi:EamA family transporter [Hypericibacter sp.]|uniref:EamA family transporter n=1 Tax=Hypericibacter sp. TaxID=2705401 RepID=UPI003D6D1504